MFESCNEGKDGDLACVAFVPALSSALKTVGLEVLLPQHLDAPPDGEVVEQAGHLRK